MDLGFNRSRSRKAPNPLPAANSHRWVCFRPLLEIRAPWLRRGLGFRRLWLREVVRRGDLVSGLRAVAKGLKFRLMSVQEIKEKLAALPRNEQDEVIAYLFHLRREHDREYESQTGRRLKDKDPSHWLTPEAFERELDKRESP